MNAITFTPQQLADWKTYERVRKGGRYNMFDSRARRATRLSEERYSFVMQNFTEVKAAVALSQFKQSTKKE